MLGAPDTIEGRFELLTLHVILLTERLTGQGEAAETSRQAVFDIYVSDLDGALREMGVGDLVVGKRMKALGKAFYGRAAGYRAAIDALPDRKPLEGLIRRTILDDLADADPCPLAGYVLAGHQALGACGVSELLGGHFAWPVP